MKSSDLGNFKKHPDYKLSKSELLRGFETFSHVIENSKVLSSDFLKAYIYICKDKKVLTNISDSPLLSENIKVGFIVAKKQIHKAVIRNRIRRLLRESYRKLKHNIHYRKIETSIIISLNSRGYNYFQNNPKAKQKYIDGDMSLLINTINRYLNSI